MKSFVRVPNLWFQEDDRKTLVSRIGVNSFTLWFYLQTLSVKMNMSNVVPISIVKINKDLTGILGFSKDVNIRKMLLTLKDNGIITSDDLSEKSRPRDILYIEFTEQDYSYGFSPIDCDLFNDKIRKINPSGFAVYCLLYKNHNTNFGSDKGGFGHAEINRDSICRFVGIKDVDTVTQIVNNLRDAKSLIGFEQGKILVRDIQDEKNKDVKYLPNCYNVYAKYDIRNKYYVDFSS